MPDDSIDVSSIGPSSRTSSLTAAFAPSGKPSGSKRSAPSTGSSGGGQDQARSIISEMASRNANDESALNSRLASNRVNVQSYRKGGKVRRTGLAKLHRGERAASVRSGKGR